jgi:hypothetical protein
MNQPSRLLPDPDLEELGDRVTQALEKYAKRLRPGDLVGLIDAPIESVLENVRINVAADSAGIWLVDESRENLVFSVVNPAAERIIGHKQALAEGFISLVFASEQPICENRVAEDARHSKQIDSALGETTEAMLAVPFYLGGILCGVVSAVRWRGGCASGEAFGSGELQKIQRATVVLERLVNLALAKSILGLEL